MIRKIFITFILLLCSWNVADGTLAGGRPNAFSEGQNAFAGVINPANAVWIKDRFDIGAFLVHQKSSITNRDNNPLLPKGKTDLTYRSRGILTFDAAIHKQVKLKVAFKVIDFLLELTYL